VLLSLENRRIRTHRTVEAQGEDERSGRMDDVQKQWCMKSSQAFCCKIAILKSFANMKSAYRAIHGAIEGV